VAGTDEAVSNLRDFNASMAKASAALGEQSSAVEAEGSAIEALAGEAGDAIGELNDELEEAHEQLQQAAGDAEEALDAVTDAATDAAQSKLTQAQADLDEAHDGFGEKREDGQDELQERFTRLTEAGFQAFANTVDEVEGELERTRDACHEDFDGLEGSLEELRGRVDGARTDTGEAMQAATDEIEGEVEEVATEFTNLTQEWDSSVDETLRSGCQGVGQGLDAAYGDWTGGMESAADAMAQSASDAIAAAAAFVGEERFQAQEEALAAVLTGGGEALVTEAGQGVAALEAGQALATSLDPLVADLQIVLRVLDRIDELLKAVE
jgi:hypothetical protein